MRSSGGTKREPSREQRLRWTSSSRGHHCDTTNNYEERSHCQGDRGEGVMSAEDVGQKQETHKKCKRAKHNGSCRDHGVLHRIGPLFTGHGVSSVVSHIFHQLPAEEPISFGTGRWNR